MSAPEKPKPQPLMRRMRPLGDYLRICTKTRIRRGANHGNYAHHADSEQRHNRTQAAGARRAG